MWEGWVPVKFVFAPLLVWFICLQIYYMEIDKNYDKNVIKYVSSWSSGVIESIKFFINAQIKH